MSDIADVEYIISSFNWYQNKTADVNTYICRCSVLWSEGMDIWWYTITISKKNANHQINRITWSYDSQWKFRENKIKNRKAKFPGFLLKLKLFKIYFFPIIRFKLFILYNKLVFFYNEMFIHFDIILLKSVKH
jgi:hypothetical protein